MIPDAQIAVQIAGAGAGFGEGTRTCHTAGARQPHRRSARPRGLTPRTPGAVRRTVLATPVALMVSAMLAMLVSGGCGGRLRSPTEPQPASTGGQALTFTQIQAGIFTPRCAKSGCHVTASAAGGLVLQAGLAYGDIVGKPAQEDPQLAYIRPGNPEASYLLKKVRGDPDITGSRMPFDGPPFLTSQQIAGLTAWIQAGAPNN